MRPCTRHGESALHDGGCRAVSAMLRIHVHMLYVPVRQVSRTEGRYRRDRTTPKRYPTVMQPDSHTTRKCHGDSAASHWYHATMRDTCRTAGRYSRNLAASERHHAAIWPSCNRTITGLADSNPNNGRNTRPYRHATGQSQQISPKLSYTLAASRNRAACKSHSTQIPPRPGHSQSGTSLPCDLPVTSQTDTARN